MTKINTMTVPYLLLLVISLFISGCSSDDDIRPTCFQDENRKIIKTLTDKTGIIIAPSQDGCPNYVIKEDSGDYTLDFDPCNLPDDFKEGGLEVVFSGLVFDSSDLNICAEFFELTNIRKKE